MDIPKDLKDEIWGYCRLNNITDLNTFIIKLLKQGFNVEKYGSSPLPTIEPSTIKKLQIEIDNLKTQLEECESNHSKKDTPKKPTKDISGLDIYGE